MWDKINSCHLHRMDGEICGLADDGSCPDNQEMLDNIVVSFIVATEFGYLRVHDCVAARLCLCVMCVHAIHSQVFIHRAPQ